MGCNLTQYALPSQPSNEYGSNKRILNKISQNIKRILGKTYEYVGKNTVISKRIYSFIRDLRVCKLGLKKVTLGQFVATFKRVLIIGKGMIFCQGLFLRL